MPLESIWKQKELPRAASPAKNLCKNQKGNKEHIIGFMVHFNGPLEIDLIELPLCKGFKFCLTVIDVFSGGPECYPVKHQSTEAAAKCLIRDLVPRFRVPITIGSDRGRAFVSDTFKLVLSALSINQRLHAPYHPQSAGFIEKW